MINLHCHFLRVLLKLSASKPCNEIDRSKIQRMERRNQNKLPFNCCIWTVKHDAACYNSWSDYKIEKYQRLVMGETLVCYVNINNACLYSLMYGCNIVTHTILAWIAAHMHANGILPSWIKYFDCFACWGLKQSISVNLPFTVNSSGAIPRHVEGQRCVLSSWSWDDLSQLGKE